MADVLDSVLGDLRTRSQAAVADAAAMMQLLVRMPMYECNGGLHVDHRATEHLGREQIQKLKKAGFPFVWEEGSNHRRVRNAQLPEWACEALRERNESPMLMEMTKYEYLLTCWRGRR